MTRWWHRVVILLRVLTGHSIILSHIRGVSWHNTTSSISCDNLESKEEGEAVLDTMFILLRKTHGFIYTSITIRLAREGFDPDDSIPEN
jgi:hypothetical protein